MRRVSYRSSAIILLLLLLSTAAFPQNPEWINYLNGDFVLCTATDGNFIWSGTASGGLARINKITGERTFTTRQIPDCLTTRFIV